MVGGPLESIPPVQFWACGVPGLEGLSAEPRQPGPSHRGQAGPVAWGSPPLGPTLMMSASPVSSSLLRAGERHCWQLHRAFRMIYLDCFYGNGPQLGSPPGPMTMTLSSSGSRAFDKRWQRVWARGPSLACCSPLTARPRSWRSCVGPSRSLLAGDAPGLLAGSTVCPVQPRLGSLCQCPLPGSFHFSCWWQGSWESCPAQGGFGARSGRGHGDDTPALPLGPSHCTCPQAADRLFAS